jgi:hypothetical protein
MTPRTGPTASRRALLAVGFGPVVLLLAVVLIANVTVGLAFEDVMEDPAGLLDFHPLTGLVSQLGILIWWSAAVASLVTAALIAPRGTGAPERSFLLWSGVITAVLVLDDLFLFHENLAERYLGLGQRHIVVAYVVIAGLYVARFRSVLRSAADRWLLATSVGLLAMSLATDYIHERIIFDRTGEFIGGLVFVGSRAMPVPLSRALPTHRPVASHRRHEPSPFQPLLLPRCLIRRPPERLPRCGLDANDSGQASAY